VVAESALLENAGDGDTPLYSPAWVAQRLGVTPATLRTWHHRYELGPTGRTTGGHRRYSWLGLERLDRMRHLITSGIGVAEAARLSHQPPTTASHRPVLDHEPPPAHSAGPAAQLEPLIAAAEDLDQACIGRIVADALHTHGVVTTWTDLITPPCDGQANDSPAPQTASSPSTSCPSRSAAHSATSSDATATGNPCRRP
jgi:DNA-binding transcriptional MerR regulator